MLLRSYMNENKISACIIPTSDPHLSEYIPEHYKLREYLSGFTGSAGTLVVTENESVLWTDGRYYVQAEKELSGSGITLYRASEPGCIKIYEFLKEKLPENSTVGVDGKLFSKNGLDRIIKELEKKNIKVDAEFYPDTIWEERPRFPFEKAFLLPEEYCGESVDEKIIKIREMMKKEKVTCYLSSLPECIMWFLNIRGNDIKHTPVMLSYLLFEEKRICLYVHKEKIENDVQRHLKEHNIELRAYDDIYDDLKNIGKDSLLAADFDLCNYNLLLSLKCAYKNIKDFIYYLKCIRTQKEVSNLKNAYIKENVALTKSFYTIYHKKGIDECDVSDIIEENRKKMEGYFSPSFDTIAAFGANAAMMHYCAQKGKCAKLREDGLLLIDTGGQYFEGTTDTTRTLVLGKISKEQKENLTLVLKGNIALSNAVFPKGAKGRDVDILARGPLWKKGLDYRCGTGHGVGYFLGVHEGPQRISPSSEEELLPMMTITNEPGVYVKDGYGIRIENHLCVKEKGETEYGKFLFFEVLNYCPIGTEPLLAELLTSDEKAWLNSYNETCRKLLNPFLTEEENRWLKTYTAKI